MDLVNDQYAIEVDWAYKWPEGIGQALWYATVTGKKPALVLLVPDYQKEQKNIYRATAACALGGVRLYLESTEVAAPEP